MQVLFLKIDKLEDVEGQKEGAFTYFLAYICARMKWEKDWYCKIKNKILRFRVDELLSF